MQNLVVDDENGDDGEAWLIKTIREEYPELKQYFVASAKTEVPIAGYVDGKFCSMRIDRLLIDDVNKNIIFIDYKTDENRKEFIAHYKDQFYKYNELLHSAYPEYKITGYILWKNGWELEKII